MKRVLLFAMLAVASVAAIYLSSNVMQGEESTKVQMNRKTASFGKTGLSTATFAGGCFWCVEAAFQDVPGVRVAISGFAGGDVPNPTYMQVALGMTKHTEAVQVFYDPKVISYEGLLQVLWRTADPTDSDGQFSDRGSQYRPAIFFHNNDQKRIATRARKELAMSTRFEKPITIEIVPFKAFYPAEERHQDYYLRNPWSYKLYTIGSGRAGFQERTWGDALTVDFSKYRPSQIENKNAAMPDLMGM